MKQPFKLFLHDLKNIRRTPSFIILLIGLSILPSFYAWFNLKSSWDPYSNTGGIKVAVVNHDKGTTFKGRDINVGDSLVSELKHNDKFGWVFTDDLKDAKHELRLGHYYAMIHIPKNFSEDTTSILHKQPKRAIIDYEVNQKINAIAPKMTNAGATQITKSLNEKFVDIATKALLKESNKVGLKLQDKLPTYRKIENAVFEAEAAIPEMEKFKEKIIKIDQHQNDITKYSNEFYQLANYKDKINQGANKLVIANEHAGDIQAAGNMLVKLNNNMDTIESALNKAGQIEAKFPEINNAVQTGIKATSTANAVLSKSQTKLAPVHELLAPVDTKKQSTEKTPEITKPDLLPAKDALSEGLMALAQLTGDVAKSQQEGLSQLSTLVNSKPTASDTLTKNLQAYQTQLNQTIQFNEQLIQILNESSKQLGDLSAITNQLNTTNRILKTLNNDLSKAITASQNNQNVTVNTDNIQAAMTQLNQLQKFANQDMPQLLTAGLDSLDQSLDQIASKVSDASKFANQVDDILSNALTLSQSMNQTLTSLSDALPGMEATFTRLNQTAQENFPTFKSKVNKAAGFVQSDLPSALADLNRISLFVQQDLPGVMNKYDQASSLLKSNLPEAQKKIHELAIFAQQDLPGIEKDIKKAANKFRELDKKDSLGKLIKLLRNDLKNESDYFAEPIKLKETQIFPIPNYGSASAPFYTALALWVGALLSCNLLTTELKDKSQQGLFKLKDVYLGRMILFLILSVLQSSIVVLGNFFILDAYAKHPVYNLLFAVFVGLVFTIIVYTMVSLLGNIGKALAIIIMVLQISGGGGTFPIQVTPHFFQMIHPFLPFTYGVDLLREAVGGIVPEIVTKNLTMLFIFGSGALIFGYLLRERFEPIKHGFYSRSKASNLVE